MAKLRHYRCYFRFYPLDLFCEFYCFHLCIFVARFKHRHTLQAARSCLHAHVLVLLLWCARFSYLYSFCVAFLSLFPSLFLLYPYFFGAEYLLIYVYAKNICHCFMLRVVVLRPFLSQPARRGYSLSLSLYTLRLLCCLNYPHAFLARNAFCACVLFFFFVCMEIIRLNDFTNLQKKTVCYIFNFLLITLLR